MRLREIVFAGATSIYTVVAWAAPAMATGDDDVLLAPGALGLDQPLHGQAYEHGVSACGDDFAGAPVHDEAGRFADRAGRRDHVVDHEDGHIVDVADEVARRDLHAGLAPLVDDGQIGRPCLLH